MIPSESSAALGLALLCALFLCGFWLAPGGVLALRRRAGGELQVDVRVAYGPSTLYRLLDVYGPEGRRSFRTMLLADMAFPAVYGALLYVLADSLDSSIARHAAIAAAAFDYSENIFLLRVLRRLPSRSEAIARLAGICTSLKMAAIALTAAALAAAWLRASP